MLNRVFHAKTAVEWGYNGRHTLARHREKRKRGQTEARGIRKRVRDAWRRAGKRSTPRRTKGGKVASVHPHHDVQCNEYQVAITR